MSALRTLNAFRDDIVSTKLAKAKATNVFRKRHKNKRMSKSALVTFNLGKKQKKCPKHKRSDIVENPIIPLKHQFLSAKFERKRKFKKPSNMRPLGSLPESLRRKPPRDDTTGYVDGVDTAGLKRKKLKIKKEAATTQTQTPSPGDDDDSSPPIPPPLPPPRPRVKKETTSTSTSTPTKSRAFVSTQTPPDKRRSEKATAEDAEKMKMALETMRSDEHNIRKLKQENRALGIYIVDTTPPRKPTSSDVGVGSSTEFLNQITSTDPLPESRNAEVMANMEEMAAEQAAVQDVATDVADNTPEPVQTLTRGISNAIVATPRTVLRGAANVVGAVAPALFKAAILTTKGVISLTKGQKQQQAASEERTQVKQASLLKKVDTGSLHSQKRTPNLPSHNDQGSLLRSAALTAQNRNDTVEFEAAKNTFIDVYMPKWDKKVAARASKIDNPEERSRYKKKASVERAKLVAFDPKNLPKNISGRGVSAASSTPAPPMLFKKSYGKRKKEKRSHVQQDCANKRRKI